MWVAKTAPARPAIWQGGRYRHDKIRIAYVSADFKNHPVAQLSAGLFEHHDRSRFDVIGVSIGGNDKSEMRRRLIAGFDKFIEVENFSDDQVAKLIRTSEVDILIDLMGQTKNARLRIFASRPAPAQISFLGYAGTTGAEYIDYIIADHKLVRNGEERYYAEKIIYMPHTFMPHDATGRHISEADFTRSEFSLPEHNFVFCCFNNEYKFNPTAFQTLLKILKATDESILWLSDMHQTAKHNLRQACRSAGVNPDRLVFAVRMQSAAEHLARHRLADLFLDTLPYNAHTTASDALWAGLPVLTQFGETFAGRVAASLLAAIELPELITYTAREFETEAIRLAGDPDKLRAIRSKLQSNRATTPLFDTKGFTASIESAYEAVYERCQQGLPPDHILVRG